MLGVLRSWEPATPRLTWYGDDAERVELSGRVLTNWVVKAANLLVSECAAGPGTRVLLDLPAHWRLLVWALGGWAVQSDVVVGGEAGATARDADVVVTSRPERWLDGGADVVAVALPALARAWPDALPAGVLDGAAELMGQPDEPVFPDASAAAAPAAHGPRLLLLAEDPTTLLTRAWACWERGGSVVVATPRSPGELEGIRTQERADR